MAFHRPQDLSGGLSIVILGCGKLGTALLKGLISESLTYRQAPENGFTNATGRPRINAIHCMVRSSQSVLGIEDCVSQLRSREPERTCPHVTVSNTHNWSTSWISDADIIVLGCKPKQIKGVINDSQLVPGMSINSKEVLFVSLVGGTTVYQLKKIFSELGVPKTVIVRAILNIAASIGQSATVLSELPTPEAAEFREDCKKIESIFDRVGMTLWLPERQLHRASALAASSLAFYASIINAAAKSVVNSDSEALDDEPIAPQIAVAIAAKAALGAAELIVSGKTPDDIITQVATKGGSTRAGLEVMDREGCANIIDCAVKTCAQVTATLSQVPH